MNELAQILTGFPYVFYTPGKRGYTQGFKPLLATGAQSLSSIHEIESVFSGGTDIKAAGLFGYNDRLKIEKHKPFIPFPEVDFFVVDQVFKIPFEKTTHQKAVTKTVVPLPLVNRAEYLQTVDAIKKHIHRGDIYEVNYCMEFRAEDVQLDPAPFFARLDSLTRAPFGCLFKSGNKYVFCASPERFLQRSGKKIISQPIKGTIRKGNTDAENELLKTELLHSEKERSENVMIVDLVRNDFSRIASRGSVKVDELFGIYSFKTVHQMISTVSCQMAEGIKLNDIFMSTFPMGSMTGAPKISAMKIINRYETMSRGAYSGSLGYFNGNGNFDLNVVIRSIVYDAETRRLSFSVGSAITHYCKPEKEYEECLLKANALMRALEQ